MLLGQFQDLGQNIIVAGNVILHTSVWRADLHFQATFGVQLFNFGDDKRCTRTFKNLSCPERLSWQYTFGLVACPLAQVALLSKDVHQPMSPSAFNPGKQEQFGAFLPGRTPWVSSWINKHLEMFWNGSKWFEYSKFEYSKYKALINGRL